MNFNKYHNRVGTSCLGACCPKDELSYNINRGQVLGDEFLGTSSRGQVDGDKLSRDELSVGVLT